MPAPRKIFGYRLQMSARILPCEDSETVIVVHPRTTKHCFNSLGPIADIFAIISTICFRRHNLCKKCQNLTKFSHIEEYKKPVSFRRALLLNVQCGASVASKCIFIIIIL